MILNSKEALKSFINGSTYTTFEIAGYREYTGYEINNTDGGFTILLWCHYGFANDVGGRKAITRFDSNGNIAEEISMGIGTPNRVTDNPAWIIYNEQGMTLSYYSLGTLHRDRQPAIVHVVDGVIVSCEYWCQGNDITEYFDGMEPGTEEFNFQWEMVTGELEDARFIG